MRFTTFDGRLVMAIQQRRRRVEHGRSFEVDDRGHRLRIVRETGGSR